MSGYYRKTTTSGPITTIDEYHSNRIGIHTQRVKRAKKTSSTQQLRNYIRRVEAMRRLIYSNFHPGEDGFLTLTWEIGQEKPKTKKEIKTKMQHYVRRLKYYYSKHDLGLKYIYCVEIGDSGAPHAHMVLSKASTIPILILAEIWGGDVHRESLQDNMDGIAAYMMKDINPAYTCGEQNKLRIIERSRNLVKPLETKEPIKEKDIRTDIEVPTGYSINRDTLRVGATSYGYLFRSYELRCLQLKMFAQCDVS